MALRANLVASRELRSRVGARLRLDLHHRRARRSHAPTYFGIHLSTFPQAVGRFAPLHGIFPLVPLSPRGLQPRSPLHRSSAPLCTFALLPASASLRPLPPRELRRAQTRRKGDPQGVSHGPEDFNLSGFGDVVMQHGNPTRAHEATALEDALGGDHRQGFIDFL